MIPALPLLAVGVLAGVGVGLSYFGSAIAQQVLAMAGAIAGFTAGAVTGRFLLPAATGEPQSIVLTLVAAVVGAALGRMAVPMLGKLAFGVAGFLVTGISVLGILSRGRLVDAVTAVPSNPGDVNPTAVFERVTSEPTAAVGEGTVLIAVVLGLVGGTIALQFYEEFLAVATTAVGAAILGFAVPLLLAALNGGRVTASAAEFSLLWFVLVLLSGSAFELYRTRNGRSVA